MLVVSDTDHARQETFRNTEGHVDTRGFAPLRDDVTVPDDEPGSGTALGKRTDALAERLSSKRLVMRLLEVLWIFRFVLLMELNGFADLLADHAKVFGFFNGPVARVGII